jgi:Flp pilus assembly protein TadD
VASSRAYAVSLAVALVASVASLQNGFVYDDVRVVQQDERVHSLRRVPALLGEPYWSRDYANSAYRPATSISLALDWAIGGGRPLVFHVTNVLLHLAVVALVLALASRVLGPGGALVAALWFAVQPVHVEAMANVVGRSELLAAVGYLLAVLAYVADGDAAAAGRRDTRRGALAVAVLAGCAVAFGAKEHALTLPAVLLLADAWRARDAGEPARSRVGRHVVLWCGVMALAAGYLAARAWAVGGSFATGVAAPGLEGQSVWGRVLVMAPALLIWLRWMIWPLHLSADYLPNAFVPRVILGFPQLAGLAVAAAVLAAAWLARRRLPGVTVGLVWCIVTASVAANVVFPTGVLLGERLAYLPSVGVALVAGALWQALPASRLTWPATAAVLALLAARTLDRIPVWRDQPRFLAALVTDAPESYRTHWALGAEAFRRGAFGTGEREMLAAIRIYPADAALVQELGEKYLEAGFFVPAARYLAAAYRLDTLRSDAAVRAVFAYLRANRPDSAAALGTEALHRDPAAPPLLIITGEAYFASGRVREALALGRRLVYAAPGVWSYQQDAAYAAARAGRCDEARLRLERATALAPAEPGPRDLLRKLGAGPDCGFDLGGGGRR